MSKVYLFIGVLIALTTFGAYQRHVGYQQRDAEMQAEIAIKNEEARARELRLSEQLHHTSTQLKEANDAITETQSSLARAISAGRVRLRTPSCVQANASPTAPSGDQQAATESERETLRLIAQIAADGDRAIVQLNACIDAYNQVREAANGQR